MLIYFKSSQNWQQTRDIKVVTASSNLSSFQNYIGLSPLSHVMEVYSAYDYEIVGHFTQYKHIALKSQMHRMHIGRAAPKLSLAKNSRLFLIIFVLFKGCHPQTCYQDEKCNQTHAMLAKYNILLYTLFIFFFFLC